MGDTLVTVTLEATSGIVKDNCVNTFAFSRSATPTLPPAGDITAIADALADFYNGGTTTIAQYLNDTRSRVAGHLVMRFYDITAAKQRVRVTNAKGVQVWRTPPVGSPYSVQPRTLGAVGAGSGLPAEVACCVSLRTENRASVQTEVPDADADQAVDRPKARNTGRLYLGPLTTSALAAGGAGDRRIEPNLRTAIAAAALRLDTAIEAIAGGPPDHTYSWCIWSRADGVLRKVHDVVIDDAFDTMRKRGVAPTGNTVQTLS